MLRSKVANKSWLALLFGVGSASLSPIIIKGHQLWDIETKQRFFIRGVDYNPDYYANVAEGGTGTPVPKGTDLIANDRESYWTNDLQNLVYESFKFFFCLVVEHFGCFFQRLER